MLHSITLLRREERYIILYTCKIIMVVSQIQKLSVVFTHKKAE